MIIGVPREVKAEEFRVGMTPAGAQELTNQGHQILIETMAGKGSGFSDQEYARSGAQIMSREKVFARAELLVKVKEPLPEEYDLLSPNAALFTYLHLAPNPSLTRLLLEKKVTALAYETLEREGHLPLLAPMSEVAGRMAPLMGAFYLQQCHGGTGVLPTGVNGVRSGRLLILGTGVVGTNAAKVGIGIGMETVILGRNTTALRRIDELFQGHARALPISAHAIAHEIAVADIVVGAVLVPGGRAPMLIPRTMLATMKQGAVIVDVSVDQGGCAETSRPTTHDAPVFTVDGIVHYCVANMPGAYPRTSTIALTNATLPYVKLLSTQGIDNAIATDPSIKTALNTYHGKITNIALAESLGFSEL